MAKELGREVEMGKVAESIARNFGAVFGKTIQWIPSLDKLLGATVGVPMKEPKALRELHGDQDLFLA